MYLSKNIHIQLFHVNMKSDKYLYCKFLCAKKHHTAVKQLIFLIETTSTLDLKNFI